MENLEYEKKRINSLHKKIGKLYEKLFFVYFFLFFIIFLIPKNITINSQILNDFINFMKSIFPSIGIISTSSPLTELVLLYLSIMWVFTAIFFILIILYMITLCLFFFRYDDNFIKKIKERKISFIISIFGILICFYMFDFAWSADYAINGIEMRNNKVYLPKFSSKFEIYILTLISHFAFICSAFFFLGVYDVFCKIYYGIKRG